MKELSKFWYSLNTQEQKGASWIEAQRLYSQYLREERYLIQLYKNNTTISSEFNNFLTVKRHLYKMRFYGCKQNTQRFSFFQTQDSQRNIDIIRMNDLIHLGMIIFLLPLEFNSNSSMKNRLQTLVHSSVYSSFHSAFSFLEQKWSNCCYTLEAEMPSYLHPEILVRMLNAHLKDVSFIDLLRRNLYIKSIQLEHPSVYIQYDISKYLTNILWNLWIWEFEAFIINEFELFSTFTRSKNVDRNSFSFLRKMRFSNFKKLNKNINIEANILRTINIRSSVMNMKIFFSKSCNYLRYANSWIIGMESNVLVLQVLKRRCIRFFKYRMGIFLQSSRFNYINLYKNYSWFLGSVFQLQSSSIKMRIMTADSSVLPITFLRTNILLLTIPIVSLVKLLSEYGFCKKNGYPISKSNWSIWPDSKIMERFSQIFISVSCHYSGCANKKTLGHLQYILSYSCGKTLACKHKTNLRSIWNTYSNELTHNHLSFSMTNNFSLEFLPETTKQFIKRRRIVVWDVNHIHPDPMVLLFISKSDKKRNLFVYFS